MYCRYCGTRIFYEITEDGRHYYWTARPYRKYPKMICPSRPAKPYVHKPEEVCYD